MLLLLHLTSCPIHVMAESLICIIRANIIGVSAAMWGVAGFICMYGTVYLYIHVHVCTSMSTQMLAFTYYIFRSQRPEMLLRLCTLSMRPVDLIGFVISDSGAVLLRDNNVDRQTGDLTWLEAADCPL